MPKELVKKVDNKVQILNIAVSSTSLTQVLRKIDEICQSSLKNSPFLIVTVNPEFVVLAQKDLDFARIINAANLAIPDGAGLKLVKPDLEIIPGRKVVSELVQKNYRSFFLGGREGVAQKMAQKFGGMSDQGHIDVRSQMLDARENERIIDKINKYQPDILFVAYGAPWQEKWLWQNRAQIKAKVVMGVGGSFDALTGKLKLPPAWIEKLGLEWLWRLIQEPWRWKRQLSLLEFIRLVLTRRFGVIG